MPHGDEAEEPNAARLAALERLLSDFRARGSRAVSPMDPSASAREDGDGLLETSEAGPFAASEVLERLLREFGPGIGTDRPPLAPDASEDSAPTDSQEPSELVSETAIEEVEELEEVEEPQTADPPSVLTQLLDELNAEGIDAELARVGSGTQAEFRVSFDLPAGRSTRAFYATELDAPLLIGGNLSNWRSLERYDGVWNATAATIEVRVRGDRLGPPPRYLLARLAGRSIADGDPPDAEMVDESSGVSLRIGQASELAAVLLTGAARAPRSRSMITLRVSGASVNTTQEADNLIEEIGDALALDADMRTGLGISLQRLQRRTPGFGHSRRVEGPIPFPRNRYPHAPILLYLAGRDRGTAPLIRYWSFYQVLEYFFPQHSKAQAVRLLSKHLRSPTFDPHRDEDVLKAVVLAGSAAGGAGSELEQLTTTLRSVVSSDEVVDFIEEQGGWRRLQDGKSELTRRTVRADPRSEVLQLLAQRVYDIRCRIVHSKSASQYDDGPGLLPGTHHEDLVRQELPLLEYLAQQALISVAEPLRIPTGPTSP